MRPIIADAALIAWLPALTASAASAGIDGRGSAQRVLPPYQPRWAICLRNASDRSREPRYGNPDQK